MTQAVNGSSYYLATAHPIPDCPTLQGSLEADVAVVGAGICGLATALELRARGYKVIVLEAEQLGWGASGRSGGQVLNGYACDIATIEAQVGIIAAQQMWQMSLEAVRRVEHNVQRYRIDCDLQRGSLYAAIKRRQVHALQHWQAHLAHYYEYTDLQLVSHDDLPQHIITTRYRAALYDPNNRHLHPLNYTLGLAQAALQAGVQIFTQSRVTRLEPGAQPVVHTEQGQVRCQFVALCGNAYLGAELAPRLWRRIMPVGTYIAATEPLGAMANSLLPSNVAVSDTNFVLDYFRRSADQRLLFGGRVSYSTLTPPNLKERLRSNMLRVFPYLSGSKIEYAWGGLVDITANRAPDFGRLSDNIYYAQGFSGHGMALTNLAGSLMAEAIAGQAERLDVFARLSHLPFPGGRWFRTPALVLAMLYYRMRDYL